MYRKKVGMKAPYATLLLNMAKKKDKEGYTTSVARHISNECSVVFLVFLFHQVQ